VLTIELKERIRRACRVYIYVTILGQITLRNLYGTYYVVHVFFHQDIFMRSWALSPYDQESSCLT